MVFDLRLVPRDERDGHLILTLPRWASVAMGGIAVLLATAMVVDGFSVVFALFAALFTTAALYRDTWEFVRGEAVRRTSGLLPFPHRSTWSATSVEAVRFECFHLLPRGGRGYCRIRLIVGAGETTEFVTVDGDRDGKEERLRQTAIAIARALAIPYVPAGDAGSADF